MKIIAVAFIQETALTTQGTRRKARSRALVTLSLAMICAELVSII